MTPLVQDAYVKVLALGFRSLVHLPLGWGPVGIVVIAWRQCDAHR